MALPVPAPVTGLKSVLNEVVRTRTGFIGFSMLGILLGLVLVVPFVAPFDVAGEWGDRQVWLDNPRDAAPEWSEWFAGKQLARNQVLSSCYGAQGPIPLSNATASEPCPQGGWKKLVRRTSTFGDYVFITMEKKFLITADVFPSELSFSVWADFGIVGPLLTVDWHRPDNKNLTLLQVAVDQRACPISNDTVRCKNPASNFYPLSTDSRPCCAVRELIKNWAITNFGADAQNVTLIRPEVTLFAQGGQDMLDPRRAVVLKGEYKLTLELAVGAAQLGMDAKAVIYGTVFGIAGTDSSRRDLLIGLLWGAPVALAFGAVAAVVIVVLQTILGALATWYGGWWDEAVQRAADILLILPLLPILLLIAIIYSPSIWLILLVLIGFGFVGSTSKVARSIVLQVKEEAYIESAISYGASRARILFKHILPRLLPYTFALIALSVPAFIFLEASLSFLGLGDPLLPTWGSILGQAYLGNAAFRGFWWWITFPALGIVFATVAFALLGYSFDKVLNPRLREQ